MRKTALFVLSIALCLFAAEADAAFFSKLRGRDSAGDDMFPENGSVPGLKRTSKVLTYRGETFQKHYGEAGNRYLQYGLLNMLSAEYVFGNPPGEVTIELATMDNHVAAAGLFHHHRGAVLHNRGKDVPVGVEGVIDAMRDNRNLYFYKSNIFVKIIYSGQKPVPNLLPIAKVIETNIPDGKENRPDGFRFIEIEGVNKDSVSLTPGYTFNYTFLPPSVFASAPGAGSMASDLYLITFRNTKEANQAFKQYSAHMRTLADYFDEFKRGKQRFVQGVDPTQGRVIFTAHKHVLIIAARPDGFEKGEELINRVIEKIDGEAEKKK